MHDHIRRVTTAVVRRVLLAAPLVVASAIDAPAQDDPPLVGFFSTVTEEGGARMRNAFLQRMSELGYIEGDGARYEFLYADGDFGLIGAMLTELSDLEPTLIVTGGNRVLAAPELSALEVPVIVAHGRKSAFLEVAGDLERPEGGITGILEPTYTREEELALITELVPTAARVGYLIGGDLPRLEESKLEVENAAEDQGVEAVIGEASTPDEAVSAYESLGAEGVDAIVVSQGGHFFVAMPELAGAARDAGIPTLYFAPNAVSEGGLISQGLDLEGFYRAAAGLADQVLKGAQPSEIDIVESVPLVVHVNLTAAQELSLEVPASILSRAHVVD